MSDEEPSQHVVGHWITYIATPLGGLALVLSAFVDERDAIRYAGIVLIALGLIFLSNRFVPRRRVILSVAVVVLAVAAGWANRSRDTTVLVLEDVRYGMNGENLTAEVVVGADQRTVVTGLIMAAYYVDPDSLSSCGGHDYEEITVGAVGRVTENTDGGVDVVLEQQSGEGGATLEAVGGITQVGGCNDRSSVVLRPQTPVTPESPGLVRLHLPLELKVTKTVVHETDPGGFPEEYKTKVGDPQVLFVDPTSSRPDGLDGWQIFFMVQASDSQGNCDRHLTEIWPVGEAMTSSEAESLLDRVASTSESTAWNSPC